MAERARRRSGSTLGRVVIVVIIALLVLVLGAPALSGSIGPYELLLWLTVTLTAIGITIWRSR